MRPGSPVKSLARPQGDRSAPMPNGTGGGGRGSVPSTVWVALAIYTKAVQVNNSISTAPISGGPQAIFNRSQTVEQVNTAEVVAVCVHRSEAELMVEVHKQHNGQLQAEYTITEMKVGLGEREAPQEAPATYQCIGGCGKTLTGGVSYCGPCQRKLWESSGWKGEE